MSKQAKKKIETIPLKLSVFSQNDLLDMLPYVRLASICHTAEIGTRDVKQHGSDVRIRMKLDGDEYNVTVSDRVPVVRGVPDVGNKCARCGHEDAGRTRMVGREVRFLRRRY